LFEITKSDLAGRIGILHSNHGKIETPAYVPVIHPVKQIIPTKKIKEMGFDLVITNAYITMKKFGQDATKSGIHDIINFDGAVMTDSGGYQVLEYGDVDVTPPEMAKFEQGIMTDFAIPLDKPTGYGLSKKKAKSYVDQTLKVSKETLDSSANNGQIWIGPIQGGEHEELVKRSTKNLVKQGFPMLALGSPVEFMESYEYALLASMIITAKKEMPNAIPLHLFGAGHPLTIPLAVALGCDTFDSASYVLYAKHDRYMEEDKTSHLADIRYFSCTCEVCTKFNPKEILSLESEEKMSKIALHNLFAIKAEVDRVKESIHQGRLWEYLMKKMRAHPKLFEAIDVFTKNSNYFVSTTPKFKERSIFLFSKEDQYRPEIVAFKNTIQKFKARKKIAFLTRNTTIRPAYLANEYSILKEKFKDSESIQFCFYNPFLGIIPLELSDMYPASHYEMPRKEFVPEDFPTFEKNWNAFFLKNNFDVLYISKNDEFLKPFIKLLPKSTKRKFF
jgi:7-cyano-7-deazaguanine tRNA-ribosyltransferase